ncbi:CPBP family intramembrane glutamic endopeptidase [Streptomyces sp. ISL-94]|uniref:CPBP family intramembrane glutamic endopeptidase n=1 Tax=Streptomyces sp. ISL-94 TaxID=2819190 RepID=UPI001BEBF790|nr:type II CAAX endopeptidase family protein [Streptomyces sp. ISL-94]MBT2480123.1 CPBP family intramembrane metalloprotease [Streptomyces sp. ISL-94]
MRTVKGVEDVEDVGGVRAIGATARPPRVRGTAGVFLAVAFAASGVLGAVQPALGVPAEVVQLTQFAPAAAVAALTVFQRKRVVRLLRGGALRGEGRTGALLATAALIIAVGVLAYVVHPGRAGGAWFTRPGALEQPFALITVAQLIGACGEEIGWRCLLQPLLRTRFGAVASSVTVGVLWGLWHVQVFAQRPAYAAAFLAATIGMSVALGLALDGTGGFHALVNLGMPLFLDEEAGGTLAMACFGASSLLAALLWAARAGVAAGAAPATLPGT